MKIRNLKEAGILLMLVFSAMIPLASSVAADDYDPMDPNYMSFSPTPLHVTVGLPFAVQVYVDVHSEIDTASVDNMTFLPAGIIHYTSTTQGDLFAGQIVWMTPEDNGVIDNVNGYANPITWAHTTPVNNTLGMLSNNLMYANYCGYAELVITAGGTALAGVDPGTTMVNGDVYVHPQTPASLGATQNGTGIDLTMVKSLGMDKTLIRYRTDTYPISVTDGTEAWNHTGDAVTHYGLIQGEHYYYSAWGWNETAGLYSTAYMTADEVANSQPDYGTPSPTNGSIGQPYSLTWQIPINDADSDSIDWSIECSNGQSSSGSGQSPGTKNVGLSGLSVLTWYTVWVNATDPSGTNLYTREWFNFQTTDNSPPNFGTPDPTNGAINQPVALTWEIPIDDADGDSVTWNIDCSNGQSNNGAGTVPLDASIALTGLLYSTTYTVWVNATDPGGSASWTRESFTFETVANSPPLEPYIPIPSDGATDVDIDIGFLRCVVSDPERHNMDVTFYYGNGTLIGTDTGVSSGSIAQIVIPELAEMTNYSWYVNCTDEYGAWAMGPGGAPVTNWTFETGVEKAGRGGQAGAPPGGDEILILVMAGFNPVPGAVITIYKEGYTPGAVGVMVTTAATDQEGIYEFDLPPGDYVGIVNAPGYEEKQFTFSSEAESYVVYLEELEAVSCVMLVIGVILLIIALLVTYLVKKKSIEETFGIGCVAILDVVAIILGIIFICALVLIPAGIILLILELYWLKYA